MCYLTDIDPLGMDMSKEEETNFVSDVDLLYEEIVKSNNSIKFINLHLDLLTELIEGLQTYSHNILLMKRLEDIRDNIKRSCKSVLDANEIIYDINEKNG